MVENRCLGVREPKCIRSMDPEASRTAMILQLVEFIQMPNHDADRGQFVRGVHFFGSASPLNFWDTFRVSEIPDYLESFLDDGFDTILLLVPWAQFQPETDPIKYCPVSFERLRAIFQAALERNMNVVLRLGYLWEARGVLDQTYRRYNEYSIRRDLRLAWKEYLAKLYQFASTQSNFLFAFVSWEDFYWPIFRAGSAGPADQRRQRARVNGFRDYLRRRFTLEGLNSIYGLALASWNEVEIPRESDYLYELYLPFYENEMLDAISCEAAESFPGVLMEMRVDPEWIRTPHGRKFYHWNMNFPGALRKVVYYHANIARSPSHEHSAPEAVLHLRDLLLSYCRMSALGEDKPFIDQFNFFDDTYAHWTRISEEGIPEFVEKCFEVLSRYSSGYAIWGYQDWPKDVIYNGTFELGADGWILMSGASIFALQGSSAPADGKLLLRQGQSVRQQGFVLKLPADQPRVVAVTGCPMEGSEAKLCIELNESVAEMNLKGNKQTEYSVSFKEGDPIMLTITAVEGAATISQIRLYDRYYSQGFRSHSGTPRPAVEAFRLLNHRLASR